MPVATAAGPAMTRGNDHQELCEERIENRIDNFENRFGFFEGEDVEFVCDFDCFDLDLDLDQKGKQSFSPPFPA